MIAQHTNEDLAVRIGKLIDEARKQTLTVVNTTMVYTYYEIGRMIVEDEQNGKRRADYGKQVLKNVAKQLSAKYGKGFSYSNLKQMRQFFLTYSNNAIELDTQCLSNSKNNDGKKDRQCLSFSKPTLSWSHYLKLMRIENPEERRFYEIEASNNHWSLRELERQYDSSLYERLALSRDKQGVMALAQKGQIIEKPQDLIKDPYILEFTGLPELPVYTEKKLESKLIDHLQFFLLELGKGFTFAGRQVSAVTK